jgi:glutamate transport system substrate-binding protein
MKLTNPFHSLLGAVLLILLVSSCGSSGVASAPIEVDRSETFPAGSTMDKIQDANTVRIGVKLDQPGLSFRKPGTSQPEGFDAQVAMIIAAKLGMTPEQINWVETVTKNREAFINNGTVDLVVATYSITDTRRSVISQAGPYYVTGQQLLVRKDDSRISGPDDLDDKKVCSVTGATSIKTVQEKYAATPIPFATYTECVTQLLDGSVDAVTTDGAILLGYAAEHPDELKVVGEPFSQERYGVGFKHGDAPMCEFIRAALTAAAADDTLKRAFDATLGTAPGATYTSPTIDPSC